MENKAALLEFTVVSAEDLRIKDSPIKKNAFVMVGTDDDNWRSTSADPDGGSHPRWNEKLELALRPDDRVIRVQVHCKTASGKKMVGSAEVPMSDIVDGYIPAHQLHCLSYRLKERDGKRNGIINLCVKMVGPIPRPSVMMSKQERWAPSSSSSPYSSYGGNGSGIAIGVPVGKNLYPGQF